MESSLLCEETCRRTLLTLSDNSSLAEVNVLPLSSGLRKVSNAASYSGSMQPAHCCPSTLRMRTGCVHAYAIWCTPMHPLCMHPL